jgi:hypothetical protein
MKNDKQNAEELQYFEVTFIEKSCHAILENPVEVQDNAHPTHLPHCPDLCY